MKVPLNTAYWFELVGVIYTQVVDAVQQLQPNQYTWLIDTLRQRQNVCHLANNIFKCPSLNENFWINISLKCSSPSNWQYVIIGSDNGLAQNRQQAIIWTNDGLVCWCIYALLGLNELMDYLGLEIFWSQKDNKWQPVNKVEKSLEKMILKQFTLD